MLSASWPVRFAAALLALGALAMAVPPARAAAEYKIVTASERGTYIQIGKDLARFVAPEADVALDVLPSKGSADNVHRLRYDAGVKFAIVQSDVYQAFLDYAAAGNAEAGRLIRPLRVVLPLYNEEIYFVVRADSPLRHLHEIRGQRINIGPVQSGTAMSATTIYRLMFNEALPDRLATTYTNEEALLRLTGDRSVDVVAIVAGQPAKLLADMKPEARQFVRLLALDSKHPAAQAALKTYFPATIRSASYPNWLEEDVPGLAVKAFLVTYDYGWKGTVDHLMRFAKSLCDNFATLQTEGHPKWRDVDVRLPALGAGWRYYAPMEKVLRECNASPPVPAVAPAAASAAPSACTQQEKVLGLCNR